MEKRFAALASLPMGFAVLGAALDERRALGFTIWRAACRAAGFSVPSVMTFTLELLPLAVIGALSGGLLLLLGGCLERRRHARGAVAAHVSCALAMPVGVALCATALPLAATLVMEVTLAGLTTLAMLRIVRPHP
jgi:hypothetical protein